MLLKNILKILDKYIRSKYTENESKGGLFNWNSVESFVDCDEEIYYRSNLNLQEVLLDKYDNLAKRVLLREREILGFFNEM